MIMYSKEQMHSDQKKNTTQSPTKTAAKSVGVAAQSTQSAIAIQRARLDPISLTAADVRQLQRTLGNRAVGRLLAQTAQHHDVVPGGHIQVSQGPDVDVQRFAIPEGGSIEYSYASHFEGKHLADEIGPDLEPIAKARSMHPRNRGHVITVISRPSLEHATRAEPEMSAHPTWKLKVYVDALIARNNTIIFHPTWAQLAGEPDPNQSNRRLIEHLGDAG
jgi:hypothetical protein